MKKHRILIKYEYRMNRKNSFSILKVEYLDNLYKLDIFLGKCFRASIYVLYPKKIGLLTTSYSSRRALTSKNM